MIKINPLDVLKINPSELAARIDHAVLKPESSLKEVENAIRELEELNLRCLITTPTLAPIAKQLTRRCIGAVVGFPFGYHPIESKLKETEDLLAKGIDEIDYVANTQLYLNNMVNEYVNEVKAAADLCKSAGAVCKIIIETPLLENPHSIYRATLLILENTDNINYIKTSTGYASRPTYPEDIVSIKSAINEKNYTTGIKAAGGIRTALQALYYIALGADIIGTSKPSNILSSLKNIKEVLERKQD